MPRYVHHDGTGLPTEIPFVIQMSDRRRLASVSPPFKFLCLVEVRADFVKLSRVLTLTRGERARLSAVVQVLASGEMGWNWNEHVCFLEDPNTAGSHACFFRKHVLKKHVFRFLIKVFLRSI